MAGLKSGAIPIQGDIAPNGPCGSGILASAQRGNTVVLDPGNLSTPAPGAGVSQPAWAKSSMLGL